MNVVSKTEKNKNIYLFIIIPVLLNLLLIGFYFSGIEFLQNIISPNNEFLTRESGLLEQLQNILLLSSLIFFLRALIRQPRFEEKLFFLALSIVFTFLFLEEIDYGISLYEFLTNSNFNGSARNWHNQESYGDGQNVKYLKRSIDFANFLWFIVLPLAAVKIKVPAIKCLVPNRFFTIAFILTLFYSNIAHSLDDLGFSIINGASGSLTSNISEFREFNNYYLYLLYALQIVKTKLTLTMR